MRILYLLGLLVLFAACKKENRKQCWQCYQTTAVGGHTEDRVTEPAYQVCEKSETEIGQMLLEERVTLSDIPEGDTVTYINSCSPVKK